MQYCTSRPGFVYNFNTQSLLTFEENVKYKTDIPLTACIDFKTTAPIDNCLDPENRRMSEILTNERLKFKDLTMLKQLRDCAFSVLSKSKKIVISEMLTTELKFAGNCLMKWFNAKFKSQNIVLSNDIKIKYQSENPIDWQSGCSCICTFPIEINPTMSNATKDTMSYSDFVIQKEHKFLRNIFSEEKLSTSVALKDFPTYHKIFSRFLRVAIYLQNCLTHIQEFSDCVYDELIDFCLELCKDCENFLEIKERISSVEIKDSQQSKISKSTLQLYAFVYQRIVDFPQGKLDYETLTTNDLFIYVHKIHLHHSHVTGKILGYAHDFCNEKVRENKDIFSCIAYKFFGFDVYFLLKGIRVSVWDTKDINIGDSGLATINFGSIGEVKVIDRMKYFLTSLGRLAVTLDPIERERIEKLTIQFLTTDSYFSKVWKELTDNQKKIVLEIIVNGKGVIRYRKVESIHSLSIVPEDGTLK